MHLLLCAYCQQHHMSHQPCSSCMRSSKPQWPTWSLLLGLGLGACQAPDKDIHPAYGVEIVDADGDGFEVGIDCDDEDPEIHPQAEERPDDNIDSNCDDEDNS